MIKSTEAQSRSLLPTAPSKTGTTFVEMKDTGTKPPQKTGQNHAAMQVSDVKETEKQKMVNAIEVFYF